MKARLHVPRCQLSAPLASCSQLRSRGHLHFYPLVISRGSISGVDRCFRWPRDPGVAFLSPPLANLPPPRSLFRFSEASEKKWEVSAWTIEMSKAATQTIMGLRSAIGLQRTRPCSWCSLEGGCFPGAALRLCVRIALAYMTINANMAARKHERKNGGGKLQKRKGEQVRRKQEKRREERIE